MKQVVSVLGGRTHPLSDHTPYSTFSTSMPHRARPQGMVYLQA